MLNRLQRYSRQLSEANRNNNAGQWRGQSLEQLSEGWGDKSDNDTQAKQTDSWLRRGMSNHKKIA